MSENTDIKQVGILMLGLLGLVVIGMLTFVLGAQFQKTLCNDIDNSYYNSGVCQLSSTDTNLSESEAWNQTEKIIAAIVLVVSFLTIIVLIAIAKLILKNVRGFAGGQ
jgi:hypothetical protein